MKPIPQIESVGLPPEIHADRVVGEMLRWLAAEHAGAWKRVQAAIRPAGTPKAQARLLQAIRRAGGDTVFHTLLQEGTRGRFRIYGLDWCAWDTSRQGDVGPGDPVPGRPWLCCNIFTVDGRRKRSLESRRFLYVTHHALSRLAQRCGARTVEDLIAATKVLAVTYMRWVTKHNERPADGTRLEVEGICTAVLCRHENDLGNVVVVTILEAEA